MMGELLLRLLGLLGLLGTCRAIAPFFHSLGSAHDKLAAHVLFVVQLGDGALGFVHGLHLHKGETFRFLGVLVGNDFNRLDDADSIEELEEITLRRIEGQIANVDAGRGDFYQLRRTKTAGAFVAGTLGTSRAVIPLRTFLALRLNPGAAIRLRGSLGGWLASKDGEHFLPEGFLLWFSGHGILTATG